MGCDIHLVLERRKPNGKYVTVQTFTSGHNAHRSDGRDYYCPVAKSRNYSRFARLAGVRGDGPDPRGIPEDASQTAKFLIKQRGTDGHSHSWMDLSEAVPIFAETERWRERETADCFARQFPASFFFNVEEDEIAEHRIVFWFDN